MKWHSSVPFEERTGAYTSNEGKTMIGLIERLGPGFGRGMIWSTLWPMVFQFRVGVLLKDGVKELVEDGQGYMLCVSRMRKIIVGCCVGRWRL